MNLYRIGTWVLLSPFVALALAMCGAMGLFVGTGLYFLWIDGALWLLPVLAVAVVALMLLVSSYIAALEWLAERSDERERARRWNVHSGSSV